MAFKLQALTPAVLPSPAAALAIDPGGGVWAGGVGGVAYFDGDDWSPRISGLPINGVTALCYTRDWLIAGGTNGLARSPDGGKTWQRGASAGSAPLVTAIIAPYAKMLFAGTLNVGVLRSEDTGKTWMQMNFGLQTLEIDALVGNKHTMLAATPHGIYRSGTGGRAWKLTHESEAVVALTYLPDGRAVAALEDGAVLISADDGNTWSPLTLYHPISGITALAGEWVGTTDGVVRLWTGERLTQGAVMTLALDSRENVFAGLATGVVFGSARVDTWIELPTPPIHDLSRVVAIDGRVLLAGRMSAMLAGGVDHWALVPHTPLPLTLLTKIDGTLFISGQDGLLRSNDAGRTWDKLINVPLTQFALRGQVGYGATADGAHIVRTLDGGQTWQTARTPFGVLPVVTLQVTDGLIFAGLFDARREVVALWRSVDGGQHWLPGVEYPAEYPLIASHADPALIALPGVVLRRPDDPTQDAWERAAFDVPDVTIRAFAGDGDALYALSLTDGIFTSADRGKTWTQMQLDGQSAPPHDIMDISADGGRLYALLVGGRVFVIT